MMAPVLPASQSHHPAPALHHQSPPAQTASSTMERPQWIAAGQTALHAPAVKPAMMTVTAALGTAFSSDDSGLLEACDNCNGDELQAPAHCRQWLTVSDSTRDNCGSQLSTWLRLGGEIRHCVVTAAVLIAAVTAPGKPP